LITILFNTFQGNSEIMGLHLGSINHDHYIYGTSHRQK